MSVEQKPELASLQADRHQPAEQAVSNELPYGLCSRSLPPGLVQAMQARLSRSGDWELLGAVTTGKNGV